MPRARTPLLGPMLADRSADPTRKILFLRLLNLPVRAAQQHHARWESHPCVVADRSLDGVIYAVSPQAQQRGITAEMSRRQAIQHLPRLECIRPEPTPSENIRRHIYAILQEYAELIEEVTPAEFYLDITFNRQNIPIGFRAAQLLRSEFRREMHLDVRMGLAPNKLLARLAARVGEPPITAVERDAVPAFLADLSIDMLPGIGKKMRAALSELAVERIGQLAALDVATLQQHVGRGAARLHQRAHGIDNTSVEPHNAEEKLSSVVRFSVPLFTREDIEEALREPIALLAGSLRRRALRCSLVATELWLGDGSTKQRAHALSHYSDRDHVLIEAILQNVESEAASANGLRGFRIELRQFTDRASTQLDLFT